MESGLVEYLTLILGGVNLLFVLKIIFSDIKDLRDKIDSHVFWHLESPKYHPKRSISLTDDDS